jgi:HmuY protein
MPRLGSVILRSLGPGVLAAALTAGCSDDVTRPPPPAEGTITVDASSAYAYFSLQGGGLVTPAPTASESPSWDIAFWTTNVTLNGGAAGPAGVTGFCVCQNAAATDAEILAMTPESELADFEAVTAVPAGATFTADALTPAIAGWFTGSGATAVADPSKTFLVRLADSLAYAKVHVTSLQGASATSAGKVTLEFAVQPSPAASLGPTQTLEVDLTTAGARNVDLNTGSLTSSPTDWDLRFDGFTIRVNSGVSGPGKGGAAAGTGTFASITTAKTADQAYRADVYAGVFGAQRWYKYNLAGDNRISPTFDVYLVKRGSAVYKLQLLNYYNTTGSPRFVTFRYKQIAG